MKIWNIVGNVPEIILVECNHVGQYTIWALKGYALSFKINI